MDTKRMITGMALAMLVILSYQMFIAWLWKHNNWKPPGQQDATTQPIASNVEPAPTTQGSNTSVTTAPIPSELVNAQAPMQPGGIQVVPAANKQSVTIGSKTKDDPNYVMEVQLTPEAAAIESVTLNQYKLKVDGDAPYTFEQSVDGKREFRALASRSITINGQAIDLAGVAWTLESNSAGDAAYYVDLFSDGKPFARLRKAFHLDTRADSKGKSEGYEVGVTLAVENQSGAPITVQPTFNGPLPPLPEVSRMDRTLLGAYDKGGYINLTYHVIEELTKDHPARDMTKEEKSGLPLVWVGMGGTYFNAILRPLPTADSVTPQLYLQKVEAAVVNPEETQPERREVVMTLQTTDQKIEPQHTLALPMQVFFGPKPRSLLNNDYYSSALIGYDQTLVFASGLCSFCTFTWLINVLVNMLRGFHFVLQDWGLAIILLVVVVRMCLHPITKKSQVNMMKMSKMGPEAERLKKKFGDDKDGFNKAQMQLYKEMGFTPVLGCLPMFLQMPIFIALWQALQSTFELRQAPFLQFGRFHLTWIRDLSLPDRLIPFGHTIPLFFGMHVDALNLLPLLVAVVSFINMKYTPRPPATTPEAEQQQKMMQWMTLIFPLMFYSFPSGLNIYYLTSTSLGIWEGKRIRAHIKQHEEAEKAGKIIVEAPKGMKRRRDGDDGGLGAKRVKDPNTGPGGWLANLQRRVEEMREGADKQNRKK